MKKRTAPDRQTTRSGAGRKKHTRRRPRIRRTTGVGAAPGSLHLPEGAPPPKVTLTTYNLDQMEEIDIDRISQLDPYLKQELTCWINVAGLGDESVLRDLAEQFDVHPLALEDVVNVHQRAKVEPYGSRLYVVSRLAVADQHVHSEQVSLFLGPNYLVTFLERESTFLEAVQQRLRLGRKRIRGHGPDYLMYAILDAVIDSYFPWVDAFADQLDDLEQEITETGGAGTMHKIHLVRNELLLLRRSVRPHRDAINELIRDEHPYVRDETRVFLRDCYDHTTQLIDLLEVYREMCADLRDYSMSLAGNRMNEIMKVLTIMSTIFIPLGFIAGLYGMNFDTQFKWNMPLLQSPYGYPLVMGIMAAISSGLLLLFYRKGWLGAESK